MLAKSKSRSRKLVWDRTPGREEKRVRSRRANLYSLAREGKATGRADARVNLPEQPPIHTSVTEVGQRSNRHGQRRQASRDDLNRQALVEVLSGKAKRSRDFC